MTRTIVVCDNCGNECDNPMSIELQGPEGSRILFTFYGKDFTITDFEKDYCDLACMIEGLSNEIQQWMDQVVL